MKPKASQSLNTEETSLQTSVHAIREPILCRGLGCEVRFSPKRKDQVFCSPGCRSEYFKIARGIGSILLGRSKDDSRLKVVADDLLEFLRNPG